MPIRRDQDVAAEASDCGRQREGVGENAALRRARSGELRRLRYVLADYELRLDCIPKSLTLQRLLGGASVGGMFGIGDGKFLDASIGERGPQIVESGIGLQRRALWREQHDASFRIEHTTIDGLTGICELKDETFVGREKNLERRTLHDLRRKIAGRAEGQPHLLAAFGLEQGR